MSIAKAYLEEGIFQDLTNRETEKNVIYLIKDLDGYSCHIFVFNFENVNDLKNEWQEITSSVAANFQSNLEIEIELWNLYLVFKINTEVPKELKYIIEQDKYSSRKLVMDEFHMDDIQNLIDSIDKKIFIIQSGDLPTNQVYSDSRSIISKEDKDILVALANYKSTNRIDPFFDLYINLKNQ